MGGHLFGERVPVVPGHPIGRMRGEFIRMFVQFRQVLKGIDAVQFARVNQAHEQVPHMSPVFGLVEVGILAVQDRFLEGLFTEVVV